MSGAARLALLATVASAVCSGLMGGIFLAFSTSVMPGLSRLPVAHGMAAMQRLNAAILNPLFLLLFVGSAAVAALVLVTAPFADSEHGAWRVAGAVAYLVGAIGLTAFVNVPLNNALAAADPETPAGEALWRRYLSRWTTANHVRAVASFGAAVLLTISSRG